MCVLDTFFSFYHFPSFFKVHLSNIFPFNRALFLLSFSLSYIWKTILYQINIFCECINFIYTVVFHFCIVRVCVCVFAFFFFFFFFLYHTAGRLFIFQPRIEPGPLQWKHQILTSELSGSSQDQYIFITGSHI